MSRIISPRNDHLIKQPGDEIKDFVRDRLPPPKSVRFHEVFEEYINRHIQRFVYFEEKVTKENIEEIRNFIWTALRKLLSKSSSNHVVSDRGIDFISNVYMNHLKINNVENFIISLESPQLIANTLSDQELRKYSEIFRGTEVGDICDNVLASR